MAGSPLAKKMKLRADTRAAVVNAPTGYLGALAPLPAGVELCETLRGKFGWIQAFVRSSAELRRVAPRLVKALADESLLWLSFPKGTSGIQTDLTRDSGWDALAAADLKWVTLVSVDDTWSAFALRPYKPGEPRQRAWR